MDIKSIGTGNARCHQHKVMRIDGMDRATRATVVVHALMRPDGVLAVSVSHARERVCLVYERETVSCKAIVQWLAALGCSVREPHHQPGWFSASRGLIVGAVAGVLPLAGWLLGMRDGASMLIGGCYASACARPSC